MPRLTTTLLALFLVALAFFGTVSAAPAPQDPGTNDTGAPGAGDDTSQPADNNAGSDSPAMDGSDDGLGSMPTPIPDDGGMAEPGASGASPAPTPVATGGVGQIQQTAPGDVNGPKLEVSDPSGETVVQPGSDLTATWTMDGEGVWNPMTIQLMTGSNTGMIPLSTVGQNIDATTTGSFSFKVPDVEPYSQIYFLQFTSTNGAPSWSTRFTIAGADGSTTPPANTETINGQSVGWGNGKLKGTGPNVVGANPTSASGARPTGVNGTGITIYTDGLETGIPTDVSTQGLAAATIGALPGTGSGALSLRPVAAVVAIVAGAALLV